MAIGFLRPINTLHLLTIVYVLLSLRFETVIANTGNSCAPLFSCKSGQCVDNAVVCDLKEDCDDGSDEADCPDACPEGWFRCHNGNCLLLRWQCDGEDDCGDKSDEMDCGVISGDCKSDEFRCHDNTKCIAMRWVCDGHADCKDKSDESPGCVRKVPCNGFVCKANQECIPQGWVCDGSDDCIDGSEELNCTGVVTSCLPANLKYMCTDKSMCLEHELVCNGVQNCHDGSDEGGQCDTHTCKTSGCSHHCFQTPKVAACHCPAGYHLVKEKLCEDIDECATPGMCSHTCKNSLGSFSCSCEHGYKLAENKRFCEAEGPEPILIYTTNKELKVIRLRSGVAYSTQHALNHAVGTDYDSVEDRVYWTEVGSGTESIKSSRLDGSDQRSLVTEGINLVEDVAIDWIGRNMYFTDSGLRSICVCKHDGKYCAVLIKNVLQPRALLLDPLKGLMFWSDWSLVAAIERAGMDGSERTKIVNKDLKWPNSLALDHISQRLYWVDGKLLRIESSNLDGSDRRTHLEQKMSHPFSLAVFEDSFYWTDWVRLTLESCNKFTCQDHKVLQREEHSVPMSVHVYHPVLQGTENNPCWNSECKQLCLLAPAGGYSCACQLGQTLAPNGKYCLDDNSINILVTIEDAIYEFVEVELGRSFLKQIDHKPNMVIGAIGLNPASHTIIYSDIGNDELVALDNEHELKVLARHLGAVHGLAVDWISGNIYWTDAVTGTLEVCREDGSNRMVLVDRDLNHPFKVVLEPTKSILFVALQGIHPRIDKMDMDGSNRRKFMEGVNSVVSLAIDYKLQRLYWVDEVENKIEWATFDGQQRYQMEHDDGTPKGVAVAGEAVVWISVSTDLKLHKFNKTLKSWVIHPEFSNKTIGLFATSKDLPKGTNACANNGGCSHLCLPNQGGRICGCPAGMILDKSKLTCEVEEKCNSKEFTCTDKTCIPLSYTCNGRKDCADGLDEMDCTPSCTAQQFQCEDGLCIPASWKCDHRLQCADGSDEVDCKNILCASNYFTCENGQCIFKEWRCDGKEDCLDKSDEVNCPNTTTTCPPDYFQCKSGACIPISWRCDGDTDCRDTSDEDDTCSTKIKSCNPQLEFTCENGRCIDMDLKCDMDDDCGDGSDEAMCDVQCPSNMYKCAGSTHCILQKAKCDEVKDCPQGDDEAGCGPHQCELYEFQCKDPQICIPNKWVCDGDNDCGDNSDEKLPQCHFNTDTDVTTQTPIFMQFLETDTDDSLQESTSDSGIQKPPEGVKKACNIHEYKCENGQCISMEDLCNHRNDCEDKSDEGSFCATACVNNGGCSDLCIPTPQGPLCRCRVGYILKGKQCQDIDECAYLGACSQKCENTPGTFVCSCSDGYKLIPDRRTCKVKGEHPQLLLAYSTKIVAYTADQHLKVLVHQNGMDIHSLDFDAQLRNVYWVDVANNVIMKYSMDKSTTSVIKRDLKSPSALAINWISRLLIYWDWNNYFVTCTLDGVQCANLLETENHHVSSIKVDARSGRIYFAAWMSGMKEVGSIGKIRANGKHWAVLAGEKLIWPNCLTIDYSKDALYWVDERLKIMETMDLDGRNRRIVTRKDLGHPSSLVLFEDRLMWADWNNNVINTCEKFSCRDRSILLNNVIKINSLLVYHPVQQPNGSNPCAGKTKKCSHICVAVLGSYSCLCPTGMSFNDTENTICVESVPTSRQGHPTAQCSNKVCLNGGTCFIQKGREVCKCLETFTGNRCETASELKTDAKEGEVQKTEDQTWIAGLVIGLLFLVAATLATIFYYRRFGFPTDKLRGAFSPMPFVNPRFNTSGEPDEDILHPDCGIYIHPEDTYRSYSNPLFENGPNIDSHPKNGIVRFHAAEDAKTDLEQISKSTTRLLDLTEASKP